MAATPCVIWLARKGASHLMRRILMTEPHHEGGLLTGAGDLADACLASPYQPTMLLSFACRLHAMEAERSATGA